MPFYWIPLALANMWCRHTSRQSTIEIKTYLVNEIFQIYFKKNYIIFSGVCCLVINSNRNTIAIWFLLVITRTDLSSHIETINKVHPFPTCHLEGLYLFTMEHVLHMIWVFKRENSVDSLNVRKYILFFK